MIRAALPSDKAAVVELMKAFFFAKQLDQPDNLLGFCVPPDEAFAEANFNAALLNPGSCAFVHDVDGVARGVLIADAVDHRFGPVRAAYEFMFWIDPQYRGGLAAVRLIETYKDWARQQGCVIARMSRFEGDDEVDALYSRCGGRPVERTFLFPL